MAATDRLLDARNRLIAAPGFRRWAQKLPIFRTFANRSAERLFDLCSGFVHSQVLVACVQGGLIELLEAGPADAAWVAAACDLDPARCARLLEAAAAIGLLEHASGGRFRLAAAGAALCANDGLKALILHHEAFYADLADPLSLFRDEHFSGQLQRYWAYAGHGAVRPGDAAAVSGYTGVMAASQQLVAEQALAAVDFADCRRLLDVGGGNGAFAIAAARRWPELVITVADLPPVVELARACIDAAGLGDRIATVALDFERDSLPPDHDTLALVRVLHDHDDDVAAALLAKAADVLPPGGRVVIVEPMVDDSRAGRQLNAYFSCYFAALGQGRLRTPAALAALAAAAGFGVFSRVRTRMPLISSVAVAQRTAST